MDDAWSIERQPRPPRAPLRPLLGASEPEPAGYVLFVITPAGYAIVERDDDPPADGQLLHLDDGAYRVTSLRRSPFPQDERPCLIVERVD